MSNLRTRLGVGSDLDQDQFPSDPFLPDEVTHLYDVDEFVELLDALVESLLVPIEGNRNAGTTLYVSGAYVEGVYVEASTAEEAGYSGKHAELVFNEDGNYVAHEVVEEGWWTAQDSNL